MLGLKSIHVSRCPDGTYKRLWLSHITGNFIFEKADIMSRHHWVNTLRPRQNGRRFADDIFKRIFLNENVRISIKISLKFLRVQLTKGPINNNPSLVQVMAWRRSGDKPLAEAMMVSLLTHICVTWPQWVKQWQFVVWQQIEAWSADHIPSGLLSEFCCFSMSTNIQCSPTNYV